MRELITLTALRDFLAIFGAAVLLLRGAAWLLIRTDRAFAALARDYYREKVLGLTLRLGQWR